METVLKVKGMTCEQCETRVADALRSVPGVSGVAVDWRKGSARLEQVAVLAPEQLVRVVEEASQGTRHQYGASVVRSPVRRGGCC